MEKNQTHNHSPDGTTGALVQPIHVAPIHVAPSGLFNCVGSRNHGLTPVATTYRPFGTNAHAVRLPTRRVSIEIGRYEQNVGASWDGGCIELGPRVPGHQPPRRLCEFPAPTKFLRQSIR